MKHVLGAVLLILGFFLGSSALWAPMWVPDVFGEGFAWLGVPALVVLLLLSFYMIRIAFREMRFDGQSDHAVNPMAEPVSLGGKVKRMIISWLVIFVVCSLFLVLLIQFIV